MEKKKHILIVDDNLANIEILVMVLKNEYITAKASSGEEALKYTSEHLPDMVLLDINMPEMTGTEVCEILKADERTRNIPVIFISGLQDVKSKTRGFESGGVDYIVKPFNKDEVRARINTHLELHDYRTRLEKMVELRTLQLNEANNRLIMSQIQLIHRLGVAGEYKDNETGNHVNRVCLFSGIIGETLGLDKETVDYIRMCSPLHDIGKIGIPDRILLKPGPLTSEEWEIMRSHSGIGVDILIPGVNEYMGGNGGGGPDKEVASRLLNIAVNIAGCHHEKWDGSGYPNSLKGEDIPIEARIVSVADVFDALASRRPYKEPMPDEKCFEILREMSGTAFDPKVVDAFFSSLDKIIQVKNDLKDF